MRAGSRANAAAVVLERSPTRAAEFDPAFLRDLQFWIETDRKRALRVLKLVDAVLRDPFDGLGKPEPLKSIGHGVWSRRITQEHRMVYVVRHARVVFLQARYHY